MAKASFCSTKIVLKWSFSGYTDDSILSTDSVIVESIAIQTQHLDRCKATSRPRLLKTADVYTITYIILSRY